MGYPIKGKACNSTKLGALHSFVTPPNMHTFEIIMANSQEPVGSRREFGIEYYN